MAMRQQIGLRVLDAFIRTALCEKVRQDLVTGQIVKEADLECCVYYHVRRFLARDRRWTMLARKHVPATGYYIDILLFRKKRPRLAIELKWDRRRIAEKDCRSLGQSLRRLDVNRAYFMATNTKAMPYEPIEKRCDEQRVLYECIIPLGLEGASLRTWKARRHAYRQGMRAGKGRRLTGTKPSRRFRS